jgi:two-component system sensor histidine kinase ChiS
MIRFWKFIFISALLLIFSCSNRGTGDINQTKGFLSAEGFGSGFSAVPLDGEWEFYWNKLYNPSDFSGEKPEITGYIKVPGAWNGYDTGKETLSGDGCATYRLVIQGVEAGSYALKIPTMATAYRLWINEKEVSSNGRVAPDKSMIPMQKPAVAFYDSSGEDIVILIQVSNYMSDKGGIWETIYFGKRDTILQKRDLSLCIEMILFGAFIIMSLYHFGLYLFRKKSSFTLYFGLVCSVIALRVILTGEFILVYFFPGIEWNLQIKAEFLTVFGGFTFFMVFLKKLFSNDFSDGIVKFYFFSAVFFSLLSIILPVKISARVLPLYHGLIIAGFFIIIASLVKAVQNRREGAVYILAGCLVLIVVVVNDILDSNGIINSVYLFPYGLLLFIFSQSVVLARIFSDSFNRVEELSIELGVSYMQIEEHNKNLEARISERTSELASANEKLRELDRAKTEFFANISHELRTPLTLMLAPVEDALSGGTPDRETLEMMRRNGYNLLSLINDLLDVSRITAGRMKLAVSEIDLCETLRQFCAEMESVSKLKGIKLCCYTPREKIIIYADREKLGHVISNFFSNSLKFTDPGGRIELSVKTEGGYVLLLFSDTGCGIPADKLDTVFNRFTQGDSSSTRGHEGTGLGLSIVRDLVRLHGGEVTAESREKTISPDNHGSVFTVRFLTGIDHFSGRSDVVFTEGSGETRALLPPMRGIEAEIVKPDNKPDLKVDLPEILLVEDNGDLRMLLKKMLSGLYIVHEAANGTEAIEALEENKEIDLVISDIMMPGMDGYALLKWIRNNKELEGVPVVFLTARADHNMKIEGLELGAIDYVTKPFSSDELLMRIRNQVEFKKLRDFALRNYNILVNKIKSVNKREVTEEKAFIIDAICNFIKENFMHDLTRDDLADAAGVNPDTFSRLFNQHTGKTLTDYICELRVTEAMNRLAETEDTITRISIDVGFENIRTFNRVFKKIAGVTPGEYRERRSLDN